MASHTLDNVQSRSHRRSSIDRIRPRASMELEQPLLPPVDQGRGAWLILASCCLIQLPVWGFSLVSGLFQEYFETHDELEGGTGGLAIVGTTSMGILYLLSPISFTLLTRYPHMQRYCAPVGLVLSVGGSLLSSFAHTVWQLIATQGVLCGLGNGLVFSPTTLLLDQWFIRRKGLAYGIMWAGKSVCGVALPFLTSAALDRYGARTTLRAWTVITLLTTLIALPFIKARVPPAASTSPQPLNLAFLKLLTFWTLELGNIIQSLGYFLPSTYLPSYSTTAAGLSETTGTLLLALFNATSIVGGIVLGSMCDRFAVSNIMLLSSMGSGGFFAGGFSSTWSGVLMQIKREMPSLETGLVFGLLAGGRGIGSVISGPLSEKLIQRGPVAGVHGGVSTGYATDYGAVILFTGVTALLGGWSWFWSWMRKLGGDMQS